MNHSFGMPHPSARNFLHWLQNQQFQVQCRQTQLNDGRPSKIQCATYRALDQRIAEAKLKFGLAWGSIFVSLFGQPNMWNVLSSEIATYLRHVSYLIAGNNLDC